MLPCSSRRLAGWLLAAVLAGPLPLRAQPRFELATTPTLLPKTVLPSQVRLQLTLDPDQPTFAGSVAITLRVTSAVAAITLHAEQLQGSSATLTALAADGGTAAAARPLQIRPDAATSTWQLADGAPIAPGSYRLAIGYTGRVQVSGEGLYAADFRLQGQPARWLATQLEAVHARLVMPSFDEPVFRTAFDVQVQAPAGLQVLSNMPLLRDEPVPGGVLHSFATTPAMPSYLLAVTAGRFDVLEGSAGSLPLRIFTVPGKREQARFAMAVTQQVVPFYAQYFGQPFALPKLDQIGVPGTRTGAMEDWGLISYNDAALLFDPQRSDDDTRRRVFETVAHEVAHQWFGNLVSVASWSEIWLNEAFATWMEQKAADHFHPEWQMPLRQRLKLDRVMARDATAATRAIRSGPVSEDSVSDVFDGITYSKGGAVLSMLEQWLGEDVFQRGLAAYMRDRALQPATAGDLWFHIGRAAGQPVAAVAASWTDQPGLPLLQVAARCVGSGRKAATAVTLAQSRFSEGEPLPPGLWRMPLRLVRGSGAAAQQRTLLLTTARASVTLPGCNAEPLLANAGGRGYYVVDYDAQTWARLTDAMPALQPAERVALLSDSFALASAGRRLMAAHFALLHQLPRLPLQDPGRAALFQQASAQWRLLDVALDGTAAQPALRQAGIALFAPELQRLGWVPAAGEPSETASLRAGLIRGLAALGDAATVAGVQQRLAAALLPAGDVAGDVAHHTAGDTASDTPGDKAGAAAGDKASDKAIDKESDKASKAAVNPAARSAAGGLAPLPPSIRTAVLAAAGADVDDAGFERLLAALLAADTAGERWTLAAAVAGSRDPARAERVLALALTDALPPDMRVELPGLVAQTPALAPLAYRFALIHWPVLAEAAGVGGFGGRHNLLPDAVGTSSDPALAAQMLRDQRRLDGAAGDAEAANALARVQGRARLRAREAPLLAAVLSGWPR